MDVKALLKSRRARLAGVGIAAAAGAAAWYLHGRGKTPAAAAVTDQTASGALPAASIAGQFPDTSGTDVASWLGSQDTALQSQFADWLAQAGQQQQDFLAQLSSEQSPATPRSVFPHPGTRDPVTGRIVIRETVGTTAGTPSKVKIKK